MLALQNEISWRKDKAVFGKISQNLATQLRACCLIFALIDTVLTVVLPLCVAVPGAWGSMCMSLCSEPEIQTSWYTVTCLLKVNILMKTAPVI